MSDIKAALLQSPQLTAKIQPQQFAASLQAAGPPGPTGPPGDPATQTPWAQSIDAGQHDLNNAEYIFAQDIICGYTDFTSTGPATLMGPGTFTWYGPNGSFAGRWNMVLNGAEAGADSGSNFWIYRYHDDGSPIVPPVLTINRATGVVDFAVQPTVQGGPLMVEVAALEQRVAALEERLARFIL